MVQVPFFNSGFFLPSGTVINGDFVAEFGGTIAGVVNGHVQVKKGRVTIAGKATINGNVYAHDLTVKGKVKGNVYCGGKVSTAKGGEVTGNIFAAEAMIDKDSIVKGAVSKLGEMPSPIDTSTAGDAAIPEMPEAPVVDKTKPEDPPQNWF